jgi:hypothetical protein
MVEEVVDFVDQVDAVLFGGSDSGICGVFVPQPVFMQQKEARVP